MAVADLGHENAPGSQVIGCPREDFHDDVESVFAGGQRQRRFVAVFRRQRLHVGARDVRRVGDNEVVAHTCQPFEQVRLDQLHALAQSILFDIDARHRERIVGDIGRVHPRLRERVRERHGDAAAAGAQIERALRVPGL